MFKVNSKDTRSMLLLILNIITPCSGVSIVNFEQVNTDSDGIKHFQASIYLLKVNNKNTRTLCEICSKLTRHEIRLEASYKLYKDCGLKNVDIRRKIMSLQCSWVNRLYNDSFHEWK